MVVTGVVHTPDNVHATADTILRGNALASMSELLPTTIRLEGTAVMQGVFVPWHTLAVVRWEVTALDTLTAIGTVPAPIMPASTVKTTVPGAFRSIVPFSAFGAPLSSSIPSRVVIASVVTTIRVEVWAIISTTIRMIVPPVRWNFVRTIVQGIVFVAIRAKALMIIPVNVRAAIRKRALTIVSLDIQADLVQVVFSGYI
ncbi:hypothetical protein DICSQDRAFT_171096 [Dichomitus squalens LYAD-421 SS1]|uniref:Uncharacterized protein n=1 Tax=Dichomitus squalens (strain LYAD-421) TaxID=732165 RepID=R7SW00_DICSQ|nr:uncharacterized protein DICSQDRAFT_171096 [Dichomitus squalens LYAD-421 SS1]EJF60374.1 hypothetical protein DICSQDRAFT_171096 [Dichomitus squalens LYAD-421 SS1]